MKKSKSTGVEALFADSMKLFFETNKSEITSLVLESVHENWYKGEVNLFFKSALEAEIKGAMKVYVENIKDQVWSEVKDLFREDGHFKDVVKDMVKSRMSTSISECLKREISDEMIESILSRVVPSNYRLKYSHSLFSLAQN